MVDEEHESSMDMTASPKRLLNDDQPTAVKKRKISPSQYVQSGLATVVVGSKSRSFPIYADLLRAKSPFFAAKLTSQWNHGKNEIRLEEEDPDAFEVLLDYMFEDRFPDIDPGTRDNVLRLGTSYKLADFLGMKDAQNKLVDSIITRHRGSHKRFNFLALKRLWRADPRETKLFTLVLRSCLHFYMDAARDPAEVTGLNDDMKDVPDVLLLFVRGVGEYRKSLWGRVWEHEKCFFHDHSDGSACSA